MAKATQLVTSPLLAASAAASTVASTTVAAADLMVACYTAKLTGMKHKRLQSVAFVFVIVLFTLCQAECVTHSARLY